MTYLIDRQAAIDALAKFVPYAICDESTESYANGLTDAYNLILQLPSAQPEIIRCRDCKYCDRGIDEDGNPFLKCLGWVYGGTHEEDFCSHAERRTDG